MYFVIRLNNIPCPFIEGFWMVQFVLVGPNHFGLVQGGLDPFLCLLLDRFKTLWTRPKRFGPTKTNWICPKQIGLTKIVLDLGINDEHIKFRHNFRNKVFQKL